MNGQTRLWNGLLFAVVLATAAFAFGQDAAETPAPAGQGNGTPAIAAPTSQEDADLAAEIQRLRNDVDRLKRQVLYLNSVVEELENQRIPVEKTAAKPASKPAKKGTPSTAAEAPSPSPDADEKVTKTVLVFRDGHKTEAVNYAIVGQTLWIYTEQDSKKVPLADLDVTATKSANSDRGVTFQLPPSK